jgi:hypothetical protein
MHGLNRIALVCAVTMLAAGCGGGGKEVQPPAPESKKPPKQGEVQTVELELQPDNTWKVKVKGTNEQNPKKAKTILDKNVGPTMFEVTIKEGSPATFTATDPLSVWEGNTGPGGEKAPQPAQWGINSTQIIGPYLRDGGKKLVFYDLNYGTAVTLNYALRFKENGVPQVDPIIDNGGGEWQ